MDVIIKERTNLHDLQKIMAKNGELCNEYTVRTKTENKLGQRLIEEGIGILSDFEVNEKSFDFKVFNYPILIEVDGGYHKEEKSRLRDYEKDRQAQRQGFKVMRFSNWEVNERMDRCVTEIKSMINKCGRVPREIWLYPYSLFDRIKDFLKKRKPLMKKEEIRG